MRHGVMQVGVVMIALCVASLPSGTTCPHLQHPGQVTLHAGGAGEEGLPGVANIVVWDREEERSCSGGILADPFGTLGRRRHWRLVLRGGRRKSKLEVDGQGEADAGAAPIQPTALERSARSFPPPLTPSVLLPNIIFTFCSAQCPPVIHPQHSFSTIFSFSTSTSTQTPSPSLSLSLFLSPSFTSARARAHTHTHTNISCATRRWLKIAPSAKAKLPSATSSLGERNARRGEAGEKELGVFDEEDELMKIEEREGVRAWDDLVDGDDAGFDAGEQQNQQLQQRRQQQQQQHHQQEKEKEKEKQAMRERGRKMQMMGDDDDLDQCLRAEEEEKRRGGAERRRKASSSWSVLSLIEEREAEERRR